MDKQLLKERQQLIIDLARELCLKKLDQEYFELSESLIKKLGRKRNPPFLTGQPEIWAVAAIHAIGTINFLFDKSSEPYVSIDELNEFYGTKKATTGNKSKIIRDLFKLRYWDNEFSTSAMQRKNPFANLIMVNGIIISRDSLRDLE